MNDRSHTAHRLQTTLTPAQEAVAVSLRKTLLLPLDDLLSVVREFLNPNVSRSGLDRCLRRHGVGNLRAVRPVAPRPAHKPFKAYEPGYLHVDVKYLPQMADDPRTGPGTTDDPNQATRTEMPKPPEVRPDATDEETDPDDPTTGPGSTTDPNQANRT